MFQTNRTQIITKMKAVTPAKLRSSDEHCALHSGAAAMGRASLSAAHRRSHRRPRPVRKARALKRNVLWGKARAQEMERTNHDFVYDGAFSPSGPKSFLTWSLRGQRVIATPSLPCRKLILFVCRSGAFTPEHFRVVAHPRDANGDSRTAPGVDNSDLGSHARLARCWRIHQPFRHGLLD